MIFACITIVLLSIILYTLYFIYSFRQTGKRTNTPTPGLLFFALNVRTIHEKLCNWIVKNNHKDFVHLFFGPRAVVLAVDPESAKFLLTHKDSLKKDFFKSRGPNLTRYLFSNNLVGVDDADWRRHRTFYNSAFTADAYKSYYPIFQEKTEKLLSIWEKSIGNKSDTEVANGLQKFALDVLGLSIFNYEFESLDDKMNDYYDAYKYLLLNQNNPLFMYYPGADQLPISLSNNLRSSHNKLISLFETLIAEHKKNENPKTDILTHFINATYTNEESLSHDEMLANIFILFVAGHETTASALIWAFYELAKHQDIQTKLRNEINEKIGDRSPTLEDLDHMPSLSNFIDEVLRLHPPIGQMISRSAEEDVTYNRTLIPKGTLCGVSIYSIHRSQEYWKDPEKFDPDRFLPENKKGMHRFAYLPFSHGPRQCIGMMFSLIEQHLFITRFLQRFEVLPPVHNSNTLERSGFVNAPAVLNLNLKQIHS